MRSFYTSYYRELEATSQEEAYPSPLYPFAQKPGASGQKLELRWTVPRWTLHLRALDPPVPLNTDERRCAAAPPSHRRTLHAHGMPRTGGSWGPLWAPPPGPAPIAPTPPRRLASTAPSRAHPSHIVPRRARARVPRPGPAPAAHLVLISCRRAWSVPLFPLHLSHPPHPPRHPPRADGRRRRRRHHRPRRRRLRCRGAVSAAAVPSPPSPPPCHRPRRRPRRRQRRTTARSAGRPPARSRWARRRWRRPRPGVAPAFASAAPARLLLIDVLLLEEPAEVKMLPPQSWRSARGCRGAAAGGAPERGRDVSERAGRSRVRTARNRRTGSRACAHGGAGKWAAM